MAGVAVIASTIQRATLITRRMVQPGVIAMSPRSIRRGAGRGLTLTEVLVDDSAWPLAPDVRAAIEPCLIASNGGIHHYHGNSQAQDAD
ncbi:hypothetical protein ACX9NE_26835 [Mycobacterium sp. ML4]